MTPRRRSLLGDIGAIALLLLLAVVGRQPEAVAETDMPPPSDPSAGTRRWAAHPMLHLLLFAVLAGTNAVVLVAFQSEPQLVSILIGTSLGAVTIWSTWGLFIGGTPSPPGKGWLVVVLRFGVLAQCGLLTGFYLMHLDAEARSDRVSVITFGVCTAFAVLLDTVQGRRNKS